MNENISFNEMAFYYYLSQVFECRYHPTFNTSRGILEYDLFLPEFNILIEYDSYYYHLERFDFDYLKDIVASNELGFELIRIREKPLDKVSELSKFVSRDGNDYKSLDRAIARVLIYIRREFNLLFDLSVSTYRDRRSIALLKAMKI